MGEPQVETRWTRQRRLQRARRAGRIAERVATVLRGLPPGYAAEPRNSGGCWRITGPRAFCLVYYPTHNCVRYRGRSRTWAAHTVVQVCRVHAQRIPPGMLPGGETGPPRCA